MSKYDPVYKWLHAQSAGDIWSFSTTFKQIEAILGFGLPNSARTTPQWWENDGAHAQCVAWIDAGFETRNLNLARESVEFVRV
jgi:hypothetical protein